MRRPARRALWGSEPAHAGCCQEGSGGRVMNWVLTPPWSTRVIAAIALGLVVLAALRLWRERRGGALLGLHAFIAAALIFVMLNPQSLLPREHSGKSSLIVLLDTSSSMATRDAGQETRLGAALRVLNDPQTLASLNKDFVLDVRRFDRNASPLDLAQFATNAALGDASDIGTALMSAVSELGNTQAQAGVLLVSDGRATTPDTLDAAQLALARSVPIWTWTLG